MVEGTIEVPNIIEVEDSQTEGNKVWKVFMREMERIRNMRAILNKSSFQLD